MIRRIPGHFSMCAIETCNSSASLETKGVRYCVTHGKIEYTNQGIRGEHEGPIQRSHNSWYYIRGFLGCMAKGVQARSKVCAKIMGKVTGRGKSGGNGGPRAPRRKRPAMDERRQEIYPSSLNILKPRQMGGRL